MGSGKLEEWLQKDSPRVSGMSVVGMPVWEVELDAGWKTFTSEVSKLIAEAQAANKPKMEYMFRDKQYEIDFQDKVQLNKNSGFKRKIRTRTSKGARCPFTGMQMT